MSSDWTVIGIVADDVRRRPYEMTSGIAFEIAPTVGGVSVRELVPILGGVSPYQHARSPREGCQKRPPPPL